MFFKFLYQICGHPFKVGQSHPFIVAQIFNSGTRLSIHEKKEFCVFLDFIRSLTINKQLVIKEKQLVLFGKAYQHLEPNTFKAILQDKIPPKDYYLNFLFKKIPQPDQLTKLIEQLDHSKLDKIT